MSKSEPPERVQPSAPVPVAAAWTQPGKGKGKDKDDAAARAAKSKPHVQRTPAERKLIACLFHIGGTCTAGGACDYSHAERDIAAARAASEGKAKSSKAPGSKGSGAKGSSRALASVAAVTGATDAFGCVTESAYDAPRPNITRRITQAHAAPAKELWYTPKGMLSA